MTERVKKKEARELINQVSVQNYLPANYQIGLWALNDKEWQLAHQNLLLAAKKGYQPAEIALSEFYSIEGTPFYHPHYAYLWMLTSAQKQNPSAQKKLAEMYKQGIGVVANEDLAKQWLQMSNASQKNTPEVFKRTANWLSLEKTNDFSRTDYRLKGIWSDWQNPVTLKANRLNAYPKFVQVGIKELFRPSFELVNPADVPMSEYLDAILRMKGPLAKVSDFPHSKNLLNESPDGQTLAKVQHQANLGAANAQFLLGQYFLQGVGVEKNLDTARVWFQKALLQDNLDAQYELALLDIQSSDSKTQAKGLENLRDAAFKGHAFAEYVYALLSEKGLQSPENKGLLAADSEEVKNMLMLASVNHLGVAKYRLAETISRAPQTLLTQDGRLARDKMLRALYRGAVKDGIHEAELSLAFFDATSNQVERRKWAYQTAKVYAEKGNPEGALLLGLMMTKNKDTAKDAKKWFELAKGHPVGAFVWAGMLKNPEEQKKYLEKAASIDFSYASLNLAILKQQLHQSPYEDLNKSVALHNHQASFLLANLLMQTNDAKSQSQSREIFKDLAELGDTEGQWKLAYLQVMGIGGEKLTQQGNDLLQKAAQTNPMGQYVFAYLNHMSYLSDKPDEENAKKWFKLAASKVPNAWMALGYIYETHDKDYPLAKAAYEHVLSPQNAIANYNLGLIYEYGKGRPIDFAKAQQYYLTAAEKGSSQSMVRLAGVYLYGQGMDKHAKEALYWYEKAAKLGEPEAYYRLGLMYEGGVATRLSYDEALKNYEQAAKLGDERAKLAILRIQGHQTANKPIPAELKTSQAMPFMQLSVDLQYLYALDAYNQGMSEKGSKYLQKIVLRHREYVPAKNLWMQMYSQVS